jgi:hypothetical protein
VALTSDVTHHRARVAALTRSVRAGERTQAELDEARRLLAQARHPTRVAALLQHVEQLVNSWPPLTDEQVDRIAALLRKGDGPHVDK